MKPFDIELAKQGKPVCVTDMGWMFESFVTT